MNTDDTGLAMGFEALQRFLTGSDTLEQMLTKITLVATETIPGCDLTSITMLRRGRPTTPAASDKAAADLDRVQYDAGDGPCLAAIRHRGVETHDLVDDERWPLFDRAALDAGVVGVLSVPFVADEGSQRRAQCLLPHNANLRRRRGELGTALQRSAWTGSRERRRAVRWRRTRSTASGGNGVARDHQTAKGIIMAANRCSPDAAFDILRRASQNRNRKLREIAGAIVERTQQELPT